EANGAALAIDLYAVGVEVARSEARGFKGSNASTGERGEEECGVINITLNTRRSAGGALRTLRNERLCDRAVNLGDFFTRYEPRHVDDVRVQIAMRAGAGRLLAESPGHRCLRATP